jgi:hypothetical protein
MSLRVRLSSSSKIYVRHWDTWLTTRFNAIFSGTLKKKRAGPGATSAYRAELKGAATSSLLYAVPLGQDSPYTKKLMSPDLVGHL